MKRIRILIPTYNEEPNVLPLSEAIVNFFQTELSDYDYLIHFIDNKSTDRTRELITELCQKNHKIKATFNAKNFGQFNSPFYGLLQNQKFGHCDCTIIMCADFQDPIELIKTFVQKWEAGHQVVAGVKTKSKENKLVRCLRTIYYRTIKKMSSVPMIEHFTGFALYDDQFIETLKQLDDPMPFLRGIVAEYSSDIALIPYTQPKRKAGKTHNNIKTLYDAAMLSVTTYTKRLPRLATIFGGIFSGITLLGLIALGIVTPIFNLSPNYLLFMGIGLIGFINLFFIGILGEYIVNMNVRLLHRPLVIEERTIDYGEQND